MIVIDRLCEDLAMKHSVAMPSDSKPNFDWASVVQNDVYIDRSIAEEVARQVGSAITDLMLATSNDEIFSEKNKSIVIDIVRQVCDEISDDQEVNIHDIISDVLVRNSLHDIARCFLMKLAYGNDNGLGVDQSLINVKLIRRNGKIVPWNKDKVEQAVRRAFLSQCLDPVSSKLIAENVTERVISSGAKFIHIEQVQDLVQEELMKTGNFKIAEAYILYRAERARLRNDINREVMTTSGQEGLQRAMILVKMTDGSVSFWDGSDLRERISFARIGLDFAIGFEEIMTALRDNIPGELSESELESHILANACKLVRKDPNFSVFASRLSLSYLYQHILGWNPLDKDIDGLRRLHRNYFIKYIRRAVDLGLLDGDMLRYDLPRLADCLSISADLDFDIVATMSLMDNYLLRDPNTGLLLETPQIFWMRVAMGIFLKEEISWDDIAMSLYNLFKDRVFCVSEQALYFAGTRNSQLMSDYIYSVNDDIESILNKCVIESALISRLGGNLGGSWTAIRGKGGQIKGTRGVTNGIIPFMQLHKHQLAIMTSGAGAMVGSGCVSCEIWHSDILDFIGFGKEKSPSSNGGRLSTSVLIPDLFMRRVKDQKSWTLLKIDDAKVLIKSYGLEFETEYEKLECLAKENKIWSKTINANELWFVLLRNVFETGNPMILFKDQCNNSAMGAIDGCINSAGPGHSVLLSAGDDESIACGYGSIVISRYIDDDGNINFVKLHEDVATCIRAMDSMIDVNYFPTETSVARTRFYRPIGLGMTGLQNALYKLNYEFDSDEAIEFASMCARKILLFALEASCQLALEKGKFAGFRNSRWGSRRLPFDLDKGAGFLSKFDAEDMEVIDAIKMSITRSGLRNCSLLAYSTDERISKLMGCFPGVYPVTRNIFKKSYGGSDVIMFVNPAMVKTLKQENIWTDDVFEQICYFDGEIAAIDEIPNDIKAKFRTAYSIDTEKLIKMYRNLQCWIDQGLAVRLYLSCSDIEEISTMYIRCWESGIKSIYELKPSAPPAANLHCRPSRSLATESMGTLKNYPSTI
ncbi:MAG: ribonucleoside-diphosphate reductase subunit alpha [Puniceicoccales bacterium]|jgi:ribonucleoside-diphosphate reductase alpha chain|nr:ribonucleoside-diphosphate reductase subunit alpha [Puniceicoccales bacterium]